MKTRYRLYWSVCFCCKYCCNVVFSPLIRIPILDISNRVLRSSYLGNTTLVYLSQYRYSILLYSFKIFIGELEHLKYDKADLTILLILIWADSYNVVNSIYRNTFIWLSHLSNISYNGSVIIFGPAVQIFLRSCMLVLIS